MPKQDPFLTHLEELLAPLGDVRTRAMFGGYGIYQGGRMFGLVADGVLYLKVDAVNAPRFEAAGLQPFVYESPKGPMTMSYRRAPDAALDDSETLCEWARTAADAALRAEAAKKPRAVKSAKKPPATAKKKTAAKKKAAK